MKRYTIFRLLFICLAYTGSSYAQPVSFKWASEIGVFSQYDKGHSITTDVSGNVLTTGIFNGTADFDPGGATFNLTSLGTSSNAFVQKLDANGNFIWATSIGGTSNSYGESITTDAFDNVYLTGRYSGTADFDPGVSIFNITAKGSGDIFIQKLDSNGNFLWAKTVGGPDEDWGKSISIDALGNTYITGYFRDTVNFDPGIDTFNLVSNGWSDIFILKLDAAGDFVWAKSIGGSSADNGTSIILDPSGFVYLTGGYIGLVDFDPGVDSFNLNLGGSYSAFILKLDINGDFIWAKSIGANGVFAYSIAQDPWGSVFITGSYQSTVDFDPGVMIFPLTSNGLEDIFILKLDDLGDFVWAKSVGRNTFSGQDYGYSIATDAEGNAYVTGEYEGTADFDPGVDTFNLSSNDESDIFILKLDTGGNFEWAKSLGGITIDEGACVHVDDSNNVYVTGGFNWSVDFDPGPGVFSLSAGGDYNVFVLKLGECVPSTATDSITVCDSITWIDGLTYTSNNTTATHTLLGGAAYGCDSIVTLNLLVNANTGIDVQVACSNYTWMDGNVYSSSNNTATDTLSNAAGCDSIVTLNLTINSNTGIDIQVACNNYTWIDGNVYSSNNNSATDTLTNAAGCDSIVTLNLTINDNTGTDIQTACNSYTWIDGNVYTLNNNSATDTLSNMAGCDSIVTLDLTIITIDTGITILVDDNWMANSTSGTFQWIECDKDSVLLGETSAGFEPFADGSYAVIITDSGCSDTSACIPVIVVGLDYLDSEIGFSLYPNPAGEKVTFEFKTSEDRLITIFDVSGRKVLSLQSSETKVIIELGDLAKGIYQYHVQSLTSSVLIGKGKFVKE